jgi:hypothetical protein
LSHYGVICTLLSAYGSELNEIQKRAIENPLLYFAGCFFDHHCDCNGIFSVREKLDYRADPLRNAPTTGQNQQRDPKPAYRQQQAAGDIR